MTEQNKTRMERRQNAKSKRNKSKNKNKKSMWKKILLIIVLLFVAIGIGVGGLFTYYAATAPPLDPDKLSDPFSSSFYDMDGELVGELGDVKRKKVEYEDLPQVLIDAVTATEDVRFFEHSGIDLRRLAGAVKSNIVNGFGAEGASTITHQVVENSFLTPEKKIKLKVQEQWLALKLERKYSKEQILEMYLNKIFYGSNAYGVARASEIYFGKTDLHDLTLVEAAMLAGLPQRPTAYNPYESPDLMKGRVDTVLKLMVRHNKITQEEADEAREVDITSLLAGKKPESTPYQAFIQKIRDEVSKKLDGADIHTDGLKIHTTLDPSIQEHVEFLLTDSDENPIPYPDDQMQNGLVVLDTNNGAIRAIGGRRNNEGDGFNFAFQGGSQPGSTLKPILAFGPAIEYNNWSTYEQINDDKPFPTKGADDIRNWNRQYQGWMSARYALQWSLNVPTVKAADEVGLSKAQEFAEGLGITTKDDQSINIRDVIGGSTLSINPLQLAGAFRAFGNDGNYNEPYAVTKVEFPDGEVVDLTPKSKKAMSDYTAYMVTDMLKSVVTDGTGTSANIPGLPVAGKTGTTNLKDKTGSPDAWFSGYTSNYTIAVWAGGYTDEDGDRDVMPQEGTKIPQLLFKNIMTEISKGIETKDFVKPDSVVELAVEKGSNPAMLPSEFTPSANIVKELFVKGHEPGKTSEKFDKLDPVSDLSAAYNEDKEEIQVKWDYDSSADVSFEVSMSVDGGEMKEVSITEEQDILISEVEPDAEYTIQVVVANKDGSLKSEAKSTTVKIEAEAEMEEVSDLQATYNEDKKVIDASWSYDGSPAVFEVDVNGQKQNANSNQMEISNIKPGQTYTITVTPIGTEGDNKDVRAGSKNVTVKTPEETSEEPDEPENEDEIPENNNDNEVDNNNNNNNNNNENNEENNSNETNSNEAEQANNLNNNNE